MRRTSDRPETASPAATEPPSIPAQVTRPNAVQERTDLLCTVCGKTIAYAVAPDRVEADAPFFVEAHAPFCIGLR
jgi:hypothetical protein